MYKRQWYNSYTLFNTFGGGIQIISMMIFFPLLRKFLSVLKVFYVSFVMAIAGYGVLFILTLTNMSNLLLLFIPSFFIFTAFGMLTVLTTVFPVSYTHLYSADVYSCSIIHL